MSLDSQTINIVTQYYKRDLETYSACKKMFEFVGKPDLQERLAQEYYAARYASKLQEALNFDESSFELHAHLKLQIVQYAGIYEAIISHLLLNRFATHEAVIKLGKSTGYKKVDALANGTQIQHQGEEVYLCRKANEQKPWNYIKFEEKLNAAVTIGFLDERCAEVIKEIYSLRNSVHIEKAVKDEIVFEMEQCKTAYLTMFDFIKRIKEFLSPVLANTEGLTKNTIQSMSAPHQTFDFEDDSAIEQ